MTHELATGKDGQPACTCGARCWRHGSYWPMLKLPDPCAGQLRRAGTAHYCNAHGHWKDNLTARTI